MYYNHVISPAPTFVNYKINLHKSRDTYIQKYIILIRFKWGNCRKYRSFAEITNIINYSYKSAVNYAVIALYYVILNIATII